MTICTMEETMCESKSHLVEIFQYILLKGAVERDWAVGGWRGEGVKLCTSSCQQFKEREREREREGERERYKREGKRKKEMLSRTDSVGVSCEGHIIDRAVRTKTHWSLYTRRQYRLRDACCTTGLTFGLHASGTAAAGCSVGGYPLGSQLTSIFNSSVVIRTRLGPARRRS